MASFPTVRSQTSEKTQGSVKDSRKLQMFEEFISKYTKKYESDAEKDKRFDIFCQNVDKIEASNAKGKSYTLGITAFADFSAAEFSAQYAMGFKPNKELKSAKNRTAFAAPAGFEAPRTVDWVEKGGVTSVKNQGTCGSCWSFSAAGSLEGAMFVAGRQLESLSEQQIIACDTNGKGCNGGSMDDAFEYVSQNGLASFKDEPYLCQDGQSEECQQMQCDSSVRETLQAGDVVKHTDVSPEENALEAAVAQQPVSVAIEADQAVFQHYTGGVLTNDACGSQLDHGVLAVGYGEQDGTKYWRVKNSWGAQWGDNGYINIERGASSDGGECGIRKMASFPTVRSQSEQVIV